MNTCGAATQKAFQEGPITVSSDTRSWHSFLVRDTDYSELDEINLPAIPDTRIALPRKSLCAEVRTGSAWSPCHYPVGTVVLNPPGTIFQCRWRKKQQHHVLTRSLYLPESLIASVADTIKTGGLHVNPRIPHVPILRDPLLTSFSADLISAVRAGAPDFYAHSAAQWIAAHLLLGPSRSHEWCRSLDREKFSDKRLLKVFTFIEAHFSEHLSLERLALEAGMSTFHFARLFSKAAGVAPHRHIQTLRLTTAARMLLETEKKLIDIALTCGFRTASHFAAAFRQHYGRPPSEYRQYGPVSTSWPAQERSS